MDRRPAWNTADELRFIDGLGSHSEHRIPRHKLLLGYQKAIRKRMDWAGIDPLAVRFHLNSAIAKSAV